MAIQTRDTALQNEIVRLYCKFLRNGVLANPASQPLVEILDPSGSSILEILPAQEEHIGIFYVDYYIPKNLPVGTYYDRWTFQWSEDSSVETVVLPINVKTFDNYINFIGNGTTHNISNRCLMLLNELVNNFIYEATHIPIYGEQGMRIQQEDQAKRTKTYYYFNVAADEGYIANEGDVYFNNGNKYTVSQTLDMSAFFSSSSSTSTSSDSTFEPSDSSTSIDSNSSGSSSSSSTASDSSQSYSSNSSSSVSTSENSESSSETIQESIHYFTLTCVGTGDPKPSGTLTKITGDGSQKIVYNSLEKKRTKFSTIYSFAYRNWVRDWKPIVRLNNRIVEDGWYADYDGKIYFDRLMTPEDIVEVTYKFSCLSLEHLLGFLQFGLTMMNSVPPASTTYSSLDFIPVSWEGPVLLAAASQALKRLVFGTNYQEKRAIFGEEYASEAIQTFKSLYEEYSKTWDEAKKNAKTSKLPGIAQYVTPEYSLPGGRSRFFRYLYKGNG